MRHQSRSSASLHGITVLVVAIIIGASVGNVRAQDPVTTFPKNYAIALDNGDVSVVRVHYGAHEHIGVHDHSKFPTIYVYLSDSGPVRFDHDEQHSFSMTRPPTEKGAFRISPGRLERHSVENLGDISSEFLRVELKRIPLGNLEPFRGGPPASLLRNATTLEFRSQVVNVQRVICAGAAPCNLEVASGPSLLIAFSSMRLHDESRSSSLEIGDVKWLQASGPLSVSAGTGGSAHLLRIIFPKERR